MTIPCKQEVEVALIKKRLCDGDIILEKLAKKVDEVGLQVLEILGVVKILSEKVAGKDGLVDKQKEHDEVISLLKNSETISKANKSNEIINGLSFIIKVLGVTNVATVIGTIGTVISVIWLVSQMVK